MYHPGVQSRAPGELVASMVDDPDCAAEAEKPPPRRTQADKWALNYERWHGLVGQVGGRAGSVTPLGQFLCQGADFSAELVGVADGEGAAEAGQHDGHGVQALDAGV